MNINSTPEEDRNPG